MRCMRWSLYAVAEMGSLQEHSRGTRHWAHGLQCMGGAAVVLQVYGERGGRAGGAHCVRGHTGSRGCGFGAMLRLLLRRRQEMMSLVRVSQPHLWEAGLMCRTAQPGPWF